MGVCIQGEETRRVATLAASNRTNIVVVILIVVVDVAIVEIDVPGVVGVVGVCSTGPVVVGLGPALIVHPLDCSLSFVQQSDDRRQRTKKQQTNRSRSPFKGIRNLVFSCHIGGMNA